MARILVVAPSWVGDMVLAQPLFMRLHERLPSLTLDVLAPAWVAPLLARMPEVSAAIPNPFVHGELCWRERRRLGQQLAQRAYDQAIVLPNSLKSALVPFFAGIKLRTGYQGEARYVLLNDRRLLDAQAYPLLVERFARLAEPPGAALPRPLPKPQLRVDTDNQQAALSKLGLTLDKPVAAFCPGAEYGPAKRWPARHFAALAQRLHAQGYQVWLIGSPKDAQIGAQIHAQSGHLCIDLCGKTGLADAIDLLSCARMVISNDSGLMHVAAALNRPMAALYGSSSPGYTPPLSEQAQVVNLRLDCSPCFQRVCPLGHFNCMEQMTPEQVLRTLVV